MRVEGDDGELRPWHYINTGPRVSVELSESRASDLVGRRRVVGPHDQRARELALRLAHVHHGRHRALRVRRQHHRASLENDLNQK